MIGPDDEEDAGVNDSEDSRSMSPATRLQRSSRLTRLTATQRPAHIRGIVDGTPARIYNRPGVIALLKRIKLEERGPAVSNDEGAR